MNDSMASGGSFCQRTRTDPTRRTPALPRGSRTGSRPVTNISSRDRVDPDSHLYNDTNLYPFHRHEETGLYDLSRFDDRYWELFGNFLELTAERGIIVQIEIWDRWDHGGTAFVGATTEGIHR